MTKGIWLWSIQCTYLKNKLRLPPHVSSRDDSINSVSFLCTESLCRKETAPNKLDIASD